MIDVPLLHLLAFLAFVNRYLTSASSSFFSFTLLPIIPPLYLFFFIASATTSSSYYSSFPVISYFASFLPLKHRFALPCQTIHVPIIERLQVEILKGGQRYRGNKARERRGSVVVTLTNAGSKRTAVWQSFEASLYFLI